MMEPANPPLRTLIVDDEPLAVERMQLLCAENSQIELIGTANEASSALRLVEALKPDLVLLDIAMPERDGLAVASELSQLVRDVPPAVIFVTAFEGFAVEAFDLSAVDYLLKPVSSARLSRAIERVLERRRHYVPPEDGAVTHHVSEFWVPHRSELIRIAATDIERIDAERDYMRLHVGTRSYLLHETITSLESRLDPRQFIRLHRSVIVRKDRIARLCHDRSGSWHAELVDGSEVRIGRTHLANAKALAGK